MDEWLKCINTFNYIEAALHKNGRLHRTVAKLFEIISKISNQQFKRVRYIRKNVLQKEKKGKWEKGREYFSPNIRAYIIFLNTCKLFIYTKLSEK